MPFAEFGPLGRRGFLLTLLSAWLIGRTGAQPRPDDIVIVDGWVLKRSDLDHTPDAPTGEMSWFT